jgi:hypothetical protein
MLGDGLNGGTSGTSEMSEHATGDRSGLNATAPG